MSVSTTALTTSSCKLLRAPVICESKLAWSGPVTVTTVHLGSASLSKDMLSGRLLRLDAGAWGPNVAVAAQISVLCISNICESQYCLALTRDAACLGFQVTRDWLQGVVHPQQVRNISNAVWYLGKICLLVLKCCRFAEGEC